MNKLSILFSLFLVGLLSQCNRPQPEPQATCWRGRVINDWCFDGAAAIQVRTENGISIGTTWRSFVYGDTTYNNVIFLWPLPKGYGRFNKTFYFTAQEVSYEKSQSWGICRVGNAPEKKYEIIKIDSLRCF